MSKPTVSNPDTFDNLLLRLKAWHRKRFPLRVSYEIAALKVCEEADK